LFCDNFRKLRRKGLIHEFVSISCSSINKSIIVACDGGRLTRPYIRIENQKSLITNEDIKLLTEKKKTFTDLVKEGKIEYLDVNEENDVLIALTENDIKPLTTHMEIATFTILGVVAGLIPYPHHNQSPRNTYQCAMGKQAIGTIGYNQLIRCDTLLYLNLHPQIPLVKTISIELSNYDKLPAGQNASVAVMSYSGYDIEDAIILNKASLDRGFARILTLRRFETSMEKYENGTEDIRTGVDVNKNDKKFSKNLQAIDKDGLPFIGSRLNNGDLYVNKFTPVNTRDIIPQNEIKYMKSPLIYRSPIPSYVDRVILTTSPDTPELIKIMLRQTRRPELGDKFSSRHGQKGVCGMIIPQEDMPFNEQGWCPDLIMNPHGFPSRMTVGKLIELIGSKSAALDGKFKYGTAFAGDSVEDLGNILMSHGFSYSGKDILYSGITGEPLNCFVFSGPMFYQRLKHMVMDKIHARSRGPKTPLTRQPMEGRSKDGGMRLGEMERDCLVGFGASCLLLERLMISSDLFLASICGKCGYLGMKDFCQYCGDGSNMCDIKLPYAFKLLTQELMSMNIKVKFKMINN
jgi:DNA-directed RNA polymerase III subunit RPC2